MKLQTQIPLSPERNQISYDSKVLLMGSCFVEHIGDKLAYYKFNHLQNPFGIVFHPMAIEKLVTKAINLELFTENDIFLINERYQCFDVHSELGTSNKEEYLKLLNDNLLLLREYLTSASTVIFTFGTAWVYRFVETDKVVANCHKVPQKKFLKELLSVQQVAAAIENAILLIKDINPDVHIITTVSPVRHLKDGHVENTRSKAHLLAGLHELVDKRKNIFYFPSYEILMDELRDYRFYSEDMLHPNKLAISIVWEKFKTVWISEETKELQEEIEVIQKALQHKSFNEQGEAHQNFLKELRTKIISVQKRLPHSTF